MMLISEQLQKQFDGIANILNQIGERVEGNLICDVSPNNIVIDRNEEKIHNLQQLSMAKNTICEIGVNAGHSLLIMLEQNPTAEYLLFDLGNHRYTQPCVEYIKMNYPNTKITIIYGDSKKTIPNFINDTPNRMKSFELVHIDGGHGLLEFTSDFYNCRYLASSDGISIFDDYDYNEIRTFINHNLNAATIKKYENPMITETNKHFIYTIVR